MIIKGYGDIPPAYLPDVGEVVIARPSRSLPFVKAVVLAGRRTRDRRIELKVHWLESHTPDNRTMEPIIKDTVQWIMLPDDESAPPLIQQISRGDM